MAADHLNTLTFNITLAPSDPVRQGFGKGLVIVDLANNSLNGDTTREYNEVADLAADLTAGYIDQATVDMVTVGLSQPLKPAGIKVGAVDLVGLETWGAAYDRIAAADPDFYGVTVESRTAADIVSAATAIETAGVHQLFFQSADADWKTTGVPAGFSAIDDYERSSLVFHDTATEYADMAWVANRLAFDPDEKSADWRCQLASVAALATALTSTERNFIIDTNHGNVALPLTANYPQWLHPGQNMAGRSIYEILTVDWLRARLTEDYADLLAGLSARGAKLVLGNTGQGMLEGMIRRRLQQGASLGESSHFVKGQTRVTPQAITAADSTAKRMRFKVEYVHAQSALKATINIFAQNVALGEA